MAPGNYKVAKQSNVNDDTWIPMDNFIHAIMVKPFLPLSKLSSLKDYSNNYQDLYPGSELYIFEQTKIKNRSRAYLCWDPLPQDYVARANSLGSKLPDVSTKTTIFPTKYATLNPTRYTGDVPSLKIHHSKVQSLNESKISMPDNFMNQLKNSDKLENTILVEYLKLDKKPRIPDFPIFRFDERPVRDEFGPILSLLGSYIMVSYTNNEMNAYEQLTKLYCQLEKIHIKLRFNLYTNDNKSFLIRHATSIHSKACKHLTQDIKKELRNSKLNDKRNLSNKIDSSGFNGIFARDVNTGELLALGNSDISTFMTSSIFFGFLNDFPLTNLEAIHSLNINKNKEFFEFTPVGMLIEVLDINNDANGLDPKFSNVSASMYLRTKDIILTDSFTVNIKTDNILSLDNISTALFSNIDEEKAENETIYLVVVLYEDIPIKISSKTKSTYDFTGATSSPEFNFLDSVKRGISVGVADITRVFSNKKGALNTGVAYKFKVNLFGSYFEPASSISNTREYSSTGGWGELIENIVKSSTKGVVVNPRAIYLWISIKEFRGKLELNRIIDSNNFAIKNIPQYGYDASLNPEERVMLKIGRVSILTDDNIRSNVRLISVRIVSKNANLLFSTSSTDEKTNDWSFISAIPGEILGDEIRVTGIEQLMDNESISVYVYFNGFLSGTGEIDIFKDNKLCLTQGFEELILPSFNHNCKIIIELSKVYFGNKFCVPDDVSNFLNYDNICNHQITNEQTGLEKVLYLERVVRKLNSVDIKIIQKYTTEIFTKYIMLFCEINEIDVDYDLKKEAIMAITGSGSELHLKSLIDNKTFKRKIFDFSLSYSVDNNDVLPDKTKYGTYLFRAIEELLANKDKKFRHFRFACLQLYVYVVTFITINGKVEDPTGLIKKSISFYCENVLTLASGSDNFSAEEQCLIIKDMDSVIELIHNWFPPNELLYFIEQMLLSSEDKLIYETYISGLSDANEQQYVYEKLSLILKVLRLQKLKDIMYDTNDDKLDNARFISAVMDFTLNIYQASLNGQFNILVMRICNSVILEILLNVKKDIIQKNLFRLLPEFCRIFLVVEKYCQNEHHFRPKRLFSNLFPDAAPPDIYTVGSSMGSVVLVEILLELATIISKLVFLTENLYGNSLSIITIMKDINGHILSKHFRSKYYSSFINIDSLVLIINIVKRFVKGTFYPSDLLLSITAMFLKISNLMLLMYKDFLISTIETDDNDTLEHFNSKLWIEYLKLTLKIFNHRLSFNRNLAIIPRKAIHKICGDVNELSKTIFIECWDSLESRDDKTENIKNYGVNILSFRQRYLVFDSPSLLRHILSLALRIDEESMLIGSRIILQMLLTSWKIKKALSDVKILIVLAFYNLSMLNPIIFENLDHVKFIRANFSIMNIRKYDGKLIECLLLFYNEISQFLLLLIHTQSTPDIEEYANSRTMLQLDVLSYLLDAKRPLQFYKLLSELFNQYIERKDFVQAALCLEHVANTYDWNPTDYLDELTFFSLPSQSSFERKESLYIKSAEYFVKGSKLEKALTIYKDLATAYENINYNLNGLSFVYLQISKIYKDLQTLDRLDPSYFCVMFLGYGFPASKRNKMFIYEGMPFEHISSMHARLLRYHQGSTIVNSLNNAMELKNAPTVGKFLYVTTVEPQLNISDEYYSSETNYDLANKVRTYVENRDLKTFVSLRRLPGSTSVVDLWVEEDKYVTAATFPTLMNYSEIVSIVIKKLSPIENATRMLQLKIQELCSFENICCKTITEKGPSSIIYLEMSRCVTGTISAPINGGIIQYKEFFEMSQLANKPTEEEFIILTKLFDELAMVLGRCLVLLRKIIPSDELEKSHAALVSQFKKNFKNEILKNNILIEDMPIEKLTKLKSKHSTK
ncbi:hypothetical protein TPHA_0B01900 [Tetrapisispora phaffii CBS 4417]|uniref:DOCKER domain-containing protein n=1 Tax=Tetrapisispora phaffii (strain ATCC 24235 / CBS 4417 / NBRC 1672 / NRRL Y-8282 / UCD 70-5) TaxID=1071381 RepID=G8BPD1_TETPH|nr:hypothetical protein TPHA_0B01900 [Tetrapisispora phaffii CBS 4417]CCE61862.1 hypothetical protein TPHA_0B01900 [Tetrapisispora phaffii CBS 4417]